MSDLCVRHLLRDHREVEKALRGLESLLAEQSRDPRWEKKEREDFAWITQVLDRHLDRHIRKEDEVLFPALEAFLPREVGPLAVLRGEHEDVREIFRRLRDAGAARARQDGPPELAQLIERFGGALVRIIRDHIYKEDRVLFPMVARFLSPERDAHLLGLMEAIERPDKSTGRV